MNGSKGTTNKFVLSMLVLAILAPVPISAEEVQKVTIVAPDGVRLDGRYFSPARPGPAVLLLSMCDPTTDQSEWSHVASKLRDGGVHVLTFDYRSFGESEGSRPMMGGTLDDAMKLWRKNWMGDVEAALALLVSRDGASSESVAIGGASCGVFMGLELALDHPETVAFVSLGGPIDELQKQRLSENTGLPILIASANEGPALEWSDALFESSANTETSVTKYKYVTHGTKLFEHVPEVQDEIVAWLLDKLGS